MSFDFSSMDTLTIILISVIGVLAVALIAVLVVLIVVMKKRKNTAAQDVVYDYAPAQREMQGYRPVKANQPTEMPGAPKSYRSPYEQEAPRYPEPAPYKEPEKYAPYTPAGYENNAPFDYRSQEQNDYRGGDTKNYPGKNMMDQPAPAPTGYQPPKPAYAEPAKAPDPAPMVFSEQPAYPQPQEAPDPEPVKAEEPDAPKKEANDFSGGAPAGYAVNTPYVADDSENTTLLPGTAAGFLILRKNNSDRIMISKPEFYIGKERAKVDYCVTGNSSVSRKHARINIRGGKCFITDLGSTNGTFINGTKLAPQQEIALIAGDKFQLSNEEFEFIG